MNRLRQFGVEVVTILALIYGVLVIVAFLHALTTGEYDILRVLLGGGR